MIEIEIDRDEIYREIQRETRDDKVYKCLSGFKFYPFLFHF